MIFLISDIIIKKNLYFTIFLLFNQEEENEKYFPNNSIFVMLNIKLFLGLFPVILI